jgi:dipeptidyl aminopeptidase/acylaminoacyl peptidase
LGLSLSRRRAPSVALLSFLSCRLLLAFASEASGVSREPITVDALARRARIPLAVLSPDGRDAAYLVVRGDPLRNRYSLSLRVIGTASNSVPLVLREYELQPEEVFDEGSWLLPGACDLRWIANGQLLFLARDAGAMKALLWQKSDRSVKTVIDGHDVIELDESPARGDSIVVTTMDYLDSPENDARSPPDFAWRIRDGYQFYGSLVNPKAHQRLRKQVWTLSLNSTLSLHPTGQPTEEWRPEPAEWSWFTPFTSSPDEESYLNHLTASPDGKAEVGEQLRFSRLRDAGHERTSFRVVLKRSSEVKPLTQYVDDFVILYSDIIDWSRDGKSVYYILVTPTQSRMKKVSLNGVEHPLLQSDDLLIKPCPYAKKRCHLVSDDGNRFLMTRSSSRIPDELVFIDAGRSSLQVLDSPNANFTTAQIPQVRFYTIRGGDGTGWGRLYLPANARQGVRNPLLFTQYMSAPGFPTDVGDEIPIYPLTAAGIAVFVMNSVGWNQLSTRGDFQVELDRVERPLAAMKEVLDTLDGEGIVDSTRVGLAGVSYGAEIAMYAYWKWDRLRAVSAATASWEPSSYIFGGVAYSHFLDRRGLDDPVKHGLDQWRRLSAGLNAHSALPPLLFQSPDREETDTVATWFNLRRADAQVEWYEYPFEGHVKNRPADKWWVYSRNLDWFRFWLKDQQDSDPKKSDQYARWSAMKSALQENSSVGRNTH